MTKRFYITTDGTDVIALQDEIGVKAIPFSEFEEVYDMNSRIDLDGRRVTDFENILRSVSAADGTEYIVLDDGKPAKNVAQVFFNGVANNKIVAQISL